MVQMGNFFQSYLKPTMRLFQNEDGISDPSCASRIDNLHEEAGFFEDSPDRETLVYVGVSNSYYIFIPGFQIVNSVMFR